MPKAVWNGVVLAESDETVVVEGNHYFPSSSLNWEHFQESAKTTRCFWKGEARYHDVVVDGEVNRDAAWHYPDPSPAASHIADHVAFWHGVHVEPSGDEAIPHPRTGLLGRFIRGDG